MNTCQSCAAYSALTKQCRAEPPQPVMITGANNEPMVIGIFPASPADSWCAQWRTETEE